MPPIEWNPVTPQKVSELLAENNRGARLSVCPTGGAASLSDRLRNESGVLLQTAGLSRIVDYPARDMTITVEAGVTISALQQKLATEQQQLPVDIPQPEKATIGGAIACNVSGPGRYGFGTFRDYLIGISAVDGQGRLFSAGGRVVKNVAGYDLCKLLIGSRGTLGVITQVTLKLVPQSQSHVWMLFGSDDLSTVESALERLNLSATRPVALELINRDAVLRGHLAISPEIPTTSYLLCVGYAGTAEETGWQAGTAHSELQALSLTSPCRLEGENALAFRRLLTEFQVSSRDETTVRASVRPSQLVSLVSGLSGTGMAIQAHAGSGILVGVFPSGSASLSDQSVLEPLRQAARACQGTWSLSPGPDDGLLGGVDPKTPAAVLMQKLKGTFDPAGVFPRI